MKSLVMGFLLSLSLNVFAHGDHSIPGALPAPLHEGVLGEAKHIEDAGHKDHHHEEDKEYFFEVKYNKITSSIDIYLLELDPKNPKVFSKLSPDKKIDVVLDFPRAKKKETVKVDLKKDKWVSLVPKNRERRFYAHISFEDKDEKYNAKVMIEKKR
jgi:hypothetical protein